MKLRALRLHGFKSFADRTEIVFHDGITVIVGPNGCGKSNIADAIRWVLGEQRPTAIRGARMEEAIFQGTVTRRGVNRGSVTIEVTNEDGALPISFQEVEIARTVYRDGGSDYSLNRAGCRLRDIQDLCRDTGLGANAYAIIENRMIDAILSERADERRGLFEEAAGIGKYKDRRRAASLRLERAETDVQRLEDLIGEVESKVRSLARQKGRAERYRDLRQRRLDVEVTLVRGQLADLERRLAEARGRLEGGQVREEGLRAGVAAAEGNVEALRVDRLAAERARADLAARLDGLRGELVRWERELAVAEERSGLAGRRLARISTEREEALQRGRRSDEGEKELLRERVHGEAALARLQAELARHAERATVVRDELARGRASVHALEAREREVARRVAQLQGDAEASQARAAEMEIQAGHLDKELAEARDALSETASQGDLFQDRAASLARDVEVARTDLERVREEALEARAALERAREYEMTAQDRHGSLAARRSGLARMESDREGVEPPVQAVLSAPPEGVHGILADFVSSAPELAPALEAYLGVLLRAVVVRDSGIAADLSRWFRESWQEGGGLIVLPLDRVPDVAGEGALLTGVSLSGPGAPWVRALLDGVDLASRSEDPSHPVRSPAVRRVAPDGSWVDREGVLRLGNPFGGIGLLERRERLQALEAEVDASAREAEAARELRQGTQERVAELERALEGAQAALREAEDADREARAREDMRSERSARLARSVEDLANQRSLTEATRERALGRAAEALREREALVEEERALREKGSAARDEWDGIQSRWEELREEESARTVERARLEGEAARIEERLEGLRAARTAVDVKLEALDVEQGELEREVERARTLRETGAADTARLFEARTAVERELKVRDRALAEVNEAIAEAERKVRDARRDEREAAEERHALELESGELTAGIERVRDRLEAEFGRSFEQLAQDAKKVEGEEQELRAELRETVDALDRLGPVNMLAVEEHEEERARLDFLTEQRDDLVEARNDLTEAIREINRTATRRFAETFEAIRENFRKTFVHLFEGGECDLWLSEPDDPLESDVEIHAAPRGKRTQRIDLLSGGERALTALALLFGIYLVKPSPFCVLDEIDAPLDEANIGRFIRLLQEFKGRSQFVVITHNPRTIEAADWIYGVTMEEPGVSTIVGVRLEEALEVAGV